MTPDYIIMREEYKNGLFPKIPVVMQGRAILLYSSKTRRVLSISKKTTPREVSSGKYDELIEINLGMEMFNIVLNAPSEDEKYLFEISITLEANITDPIQFFLNINQDIKEKINFKFAPLIRKVTRLYSVIDYTGIEGNLLNDLKDSQYGSEILGLKYRIYDVVIKPNKESMKYIERISDAKLNEAATKREADSNVNLEIHKANRAKELNDIGYVNAVFQKVVSGEISSEEAITKISDQKIENLNKFIEVMEKLKEAQITSDLKIESITDSSLDGLLNLIENVGSEEYFPSEEDIAKIEENNESVG